MSTIIERPIEMDLTFESILEELMSKPSTPIYGKDQHSLVSRIIHEVHHGSSCIATTTTASSIATSSSSTTAVGMCSHIDHAAEIQKKQEAILNAVLVHRELLLKVILHCASSQDAPDHTLPYIGKLTQCLRLITLLNDTMVKLAERRHEGRDEETYDLPTQVMDTFSPAVYEFIDYFVSSSNNGLIFAEFEHKEVIITSNSDANTVAGLSSGLHSVSSMSTLEGVSRHTSFRLDNSSTHNYTQNNSSYDDGMDDSNHSDGIGSGAGGNDESNARTIPTVHHINEHDLLYYSQYTINQQRTMLLFELLRCFPTCTVSSLDHYYFEHDMNQLNFFHNFFHSKSLTLRYYTHLKNVLLSAGIPKSVKRQCVRLLKFLIHQKSHVFKYYGNELIELIVQASTLGAATTTTATVGGPVPAAMTTTCVVTLELFCLFKQHPEFISSGLQSIVKYIHFILHVPLRGMNPAATVSSTMISAVRATSNHNLADASGVGVGEDGIASASPTSPRRTLHHQASGHNHSVSSPSLPPLPPSSPLMMHRRNSQSSHHLSVLNSNAMTSMAMKGGDVEYDYGISFIVVEYVKYRPKELSQHVFVNEMMNKWQLLQHVHLTTLNLKEANNNNDNGNGNNNKLKGSISGHASSRTGLKSAAGKSSGNSNISDRQRTAAGHSHGHHHHHGHNDDEHRNHHQHHDDGNGNEDSDVENENQALLQCLSNYESIFVTLSEMFPDSMILYCMVFYESITERNLIPMIQCMSYAATGSLIADAPDRVFSCLVELLHRFGTTSGSASAAGAASPISASNRNHTSNATTIATTNKPISGLSLASISPPPFTASHQALYNTGESSTMGGIMIGVPLQGQVLQQFVTVLFSAIRNIQILLSSQRLVLEQLNFFKKFTNIDYVQVTTIERLATMMIAENLTPDEVLWLRHTWVNQKVNTLEKYEALMKVMTLEVCMNESNSPLPPLPPQQQDQQEEAVSIEAISSASSTSPVPSIESSSASVLSPRVMTIQRALNKYLDAMIQHLPLPSRIEVNQHIRDEEKKVTLYFTCCSTGMEYSMTTKHWQTWLKIGYLLMLCHRVILDVGLGYPLEVMSDGMKQMHLIYKHLLESQKQPQSSQDSDIDTNDLFNDPIVTLLEQDELMAELRRKGFFNKMSYYQSKTIGWYLLQPDVHGSEPKELLVHSYVGNVDDEAAGVDEEPLPNTHWEDFPGTQPDTQRGLVYDVIELKPIWEGLITNKHHADTVPILIRPDTHREPVALCKIYGYGTKQGSILPTWKKRYFVLENRMFTYFDDEEDFQKDKNKPAGTPFAIIPNQTTITVNNNGDLMIQVNGVNRKLMLKFETEVDWILWKEAFEEHCSDDAYLRVKRQNIKKNPLFK